MSTFTNVLTTDIGKVRFYLRDTTEGTAAFSDEEIQLTLDMAGTVGGAVSECAKVLLMDAARYARIFTDAEGNIVDETAGVPFLEALIDRFGDAVVALPRVIVTNLGLAPNDPRNCT